MLFKLIHRIPGVVGVDGAIAYTMLGKIVSAGGSFLILLFIASFLSPDEQGYYYTFSSIIALQVFFELGFSGIITQYAAHEVAHLRWLSPSVLAGDEVHLSRLSSLLHLCLKWFGALSIALFVILACSGMVFFCHFQKEVAVVSWRLPWMLIAFTTVLQFLINPILSFLQGLNKVKETAQMRFIQQTVHVPLMIVILVCGGKLWAPGLAVLVECCLLVGLITFQFKGLLLQIFRAKNSASIAYWVEIFPFQWKIAISWASGYFITQLLNPVLFATAGAEVAGQMGMTLAVLGGIHTLSMSWITTKIPVFSSEIALSRFDELDRLFRRTMKQLIPVSISFLLILIVGVALANLFELPLGRRFLSLPLVTILALATFTNMIAYSLATYVRCHKKEPFLILSIVSGCLSAVLITGNAYLFGIYGVVVSYAAISACIGLPVVWIIYDAKKKAWHGTDAIAE